MTGANSDEDTSAVMKTVKIMSAVHDRQRNRDGIDADERPVHVAAMEQQAGHAACVITNGKSESVPLTYIGTIVARFVHHKVIADAKWILSSGTMPFQNRNETTAMTARTAISKPYT